MRAAMKTKLAITLGPFRMDTSLGFICWGRYALWLHLWKPGYYAVQWQRFGPDERHGHWPRRRKPFPKESVQP